MVKKEIPRIPLPFLLSLSILWAYCRPCLSRLSCCNLCKHRQFRVQVEVRLITLLHYKKSVFCFFFKSCFANFRPMNLHCAYYVCRCKNYMKNVYATMLERLQIPAHLPTSFQRKTKTATWEAICPRFGKNQISRKFRGEQSVSFWQDF